MLTTEYDGIEISYNETTDEWVATGTGLNAKTLTALKTKLNKLNADERRVGLLPVVKIGYREGERVSVTLIVDNAYVWVVGKSGKREKESRTSLVLDTPENLSKLAEA